MKLIQTISNKIEDELRDAEEYVTLAMQYKDTNPVQANVFFNLSAEEMKHQNMLHTEVVRLIEEYKREHGEPPKEMMARYEYLHERHIEAAKRVRAYQSLYSEQ